MESENRFLLPVTDPLVNKMISEILEKDERFASIPEVHTDEEAFRRIQFTEWAMMETDLLVYGCACFTRDKFGIQRRVDPTTIKLGDHAKGEFWGPSEPEKCESIQKLINEERHK